MDPVGKIGAICFGVGVGIKAKADQEIMPILKHKKKLYPENWDRIALLVKERAGWKCELCYADHGEPHWLTESIVVLTVHHINADPTDNRRINLIALCQRCHNKLDQPFRRLSMQERVLRLFQ